MTVRRIIHRQNPFDASRNADRAGQKLAERAPERTKYFAAREVQNKDGTFPFGEGYLYGTEPSRRDSSWKIGSGAPDAVSIAGHRGTKHEQQDVFGGERFTLWGEKAAALVVSDGVSASGSLARRASKTATDVFLRVLQESLPSTPPSGRSRHAVVERAMSQAAYAANFEVVRQVLLDQKRDGRYDKDDKRALKDDGIDLPTGALTPHKMRALAPKLDAKIAALDDEGRSALATFAVGIAVGNDFYTFSSGDAVVGLFRKSETDGKRFVHLTHRDQEVVEILRDDLPLERDVHENVITKSFGESASMSGTIRRFPALLEAGDKVIVMSDGIGPRGGRRGLSRDEIEAILDKDHDENPAKALVDAQMADVKPDEYQDNIGVAVLSVD